MARVHLLHSSNCSSLPPDSVGCQVVSLQFGLLDDYETLSIDYISNMLATILLDGTVVLVSSIKDAITTAEELRGA